MAITRYGPGDALAVRLWARDLAVETRKGLEIAPLIGTSANSIIQEKTEFKGKGDSMTFGLRVQLVGDGVSEHQTLEGNEEKLATFSDSLQINEIAHAVRVEGEDSIDQQRVLFDLRTEARDGLKDWFAERMSLWFFIQMAGYTGNTMTYRDRVIGLGPTYRGLNEVRAPSSGRVVRQNGKATDEALVSADVMTLDLVTKVKERARLANPKIRPVRVNGADKYVMYLHPTQVTDLKLSAQGDGPISWADIQLAALQGGERTNNPIYTGAIGEYDGVVFRENEDVVPGMNSTTGAEITTVRRALFLGAQAGAIGFSSKYSKSSPYKWVEKTFDYERELGVSVQGLMGMKKTRFDGQDFGSIVVPTYAAAHT